MQEKGQTKDMPGSGSEEKQRKETGKCGIIRLLEQSKLLSVAVLLVAVAALQAGTAKAHGTEPLEEDSCSRRSGENIVHLSAYQPQVDIAGHYCTDIPSAGSTVLVIDLVDPPLREMPIAIKLIQGNSEEGETVAQIPAAVYKDGVINTQQTLEEGRYLLVVTADGMPPLKYVYHLRVEMINYAEVFRATIGPAVGLILITLIGYKLYKSKRFRNWLSARRRKKGV